MSFSDYFELSPSERAAMRQQRDALAPEKNFSRKRSAELGIFGLRRAVRPRAPRGGRGYLPRGLAKPEWLPVKDMRVPQLANHAPRIEGLVAPRRSEATPGGLHSVWMSGQSRTEVRFQLVRMERLVCANRKSGEREHSPDRRNDRALRRPVIRTAVRSYPRRRCACQGCSRWCPVRCL